MKRRTFIQKSAIGAAVLGSPLFVPSFSGRRKFRAGLIGAGWYGMVVSKAALKVGGVEVVAVCDVDSEHLRASADELTKLQNTAPKTFKYYQDLLDMKGLDMVFIASPPQWHALQFIAACEKGLDIYCEKPLSYDPLEGLAMLRAAKKAGNVVQVGFQRRQSESYKYAQQYINEGKAGKIQQVVAQIHYRPNPGDTTIQDPPASLDWDEWCGPAPKLPYRPSIAHLSWRLEKEYGNGHLVDWGIHHVDIVRTVLGESIPNEFNTSGGLFMLKDQITTPDTLLAKMSFREIPFIWQHRMWGAGDISPEFNNGIFFYGEKETIFVSNNRFYSMPIGRNVERLELDLPTKEGEQELHMKEFLEALRSKNPEGVSCTVEDSFESAATVQLAMISYYTGSTVKWDNNRKTVSGNPEAAGLLKRKYRDGWKHPG